MSEIKTAYEVAVERTAHLPAAEVIQPVDRVPPTAFQEWLWGFDQEFSKHHEWYGLYSEADLEAAFNAGAASSNPQWISKGTR